MQGAPGLNMRELLEQNKIVLLRFGPDTGPVGASLARMLLREYYKAVYSIGLHMPEGRYSFACLDELQDFADLSPGRFSDTNFVAQAREFNAIFLAATQSMSALANRGNSLSAVHSFVSNCNARVLFYSDDPHTQSMAAQYDVCMLLHTLHSGQAFVVQYDTERRTHFYGMETLQQAYETTRDVLQAAYSGSDNPMPAAEAEKDSPPLFDLLEQEEAKYKAAMEKKKQAEKQASKTDADAPGECPSPSAEKEACSDRGETSSRRAGELWEDEMQDEDPQDLESQNPANYLLASFPQFFPQDGEEVKLWVFAGWLPYVEKVFRAFTESGFKLTISALYEKGGALTVRAANESRGWGQPAVLYHPPNEWIMNLMLRGTRELCPLCGMHSPKPRSRSKKDWDDNDKAELAICDACLAKLGLLLPEASMVSNSEMTAE
jgi:hypothetical protein